MRTLIKIAFNLSVLTNSVLAQTIEAWVKYERDGK